MISYIYNTIVLVTLTYFVSSIILSIANSNYMKNNNKKQKPKPATPFGNGLKRLPTFDTIKREKVKAKAKMELGDSPSKNTRSRVSSSLE